MVTDIIITLTLVLLNGFFVAAEFAIVKVRASQIELKVQSGHKSARLSAHIIDHLDGYLAATQLGITLASLGLGWVGEPVVSKIIIGLFGLFQADITPELAHQIALPIAFVLITILHIVFGELAPKSLAIQRPETTTLFIAYPLNAFYLVFRPFIRLLNGFANILLRGMGIQPVHGAEVHSSDELKYLVQQSSETGAIINSDYEIIKNAFEFSDRTTRQIMVPRNQMVVFNVETGDEKALVKLLDEGYSRIPCYENSIDNIIGIINTKDILLKLKDNSRLVIRELIRPIQITTENRKIAHLLKDFQRTHSQMAIIVNEFGGTEGLVTLEDILEELVGEIQDEYDNETPVVERIDDKTFNVMATAALNDINAFLPYALEPVNDAATLAGVILHRFGRIPAANEKMMLDEYEVTIVKRVKNMVSIVQLKDITEN
jgi:CBS domain containing-hemolysin-like protein